MWDQRYSERGFAYGTEANDFLREESSRIPAGGDVLCLAEGEGRNAVFLALQGYQVTAVDQSEVGLRNAAELAKNNGVEIATVVADLSDYDLGEDRWDGIVSIWAHVPREVRRMLHGRLGPALKRHGVMILEAYTEQQLNMEGRGGPPAERREMLMSLAGLQTELAGLDVLVGREVERMISEGQYHQGDSAVVQWVAQRPGDD